MLKYKIADIIVELKQDYPETASWYREYIYSGDEPPEVSLEAKHEEIDYYTENGVDITPAIAENIVLCSKFNSYILRYYGCFIHSSAMLFDNKVYLFSASSGVGKSTHTQKWQARFKNRVTIINDDKPSIRIIDGKCFVYGTPFAGGTNKQCNISAELGALVFLNRGETNSLEKISPMVAISLLLEQTHKYKSEKFINRQLDILSEVLEKYPAYLLKCNMDDSAVDTAFGIIKD